MKYPPKEGKTMWKLLTDKGDFRAFPSDADGYDVGGTYTVNYTTSEFQGKMYHTIRGLPRETSAGLPKETSASPEKSVNGPEKGMLMKEAIALISAGKTEADVVDIFLQANDACNTFLNVRDSKPPIALDESF